MKTSVKLCFMPRKCNILFLQGKSRCSIRFLLYPTSLFTLSQPCKKHKLKMGQTFASGRYTKEKEIDLINSIITRYYDNNKTLKDNSLSAKVELYRIICKTVEELNKQVGSIQFCVPDKHIIEDAFKAHGGGTGEALKKEQFKNILQDVIIKTKFTGTGGMLELIFYIFGVPITASLINQRVSPKPISNNILIPSVTSATVFLLALFKKI